MLKRFLPRQENFFKLFAQASNELLAAATEFSNMLQHLENQQYYVDAIAKHEKQADDVAHANFELLHKTFITPFDRYDIHHLTSRLDDVIDFINRIAQRFPFYQLSHVPSEMIQLAQLSVEACKSLDQAIHYLSSLKNSAIIFEHCNAIDVIEGQGHQVVLVGEEKLFAEENDFKKFFKLKEIYHSIKQVINGCQDVANIIKSIVLEYS